MVVGNEITEITTAEVARCDIKTDPKTGRWYIQKGGQKRLYLDNARVTDADNISVRDYLKCDEEFIVTMTLTLRTKAPNAEYAETQMLRGLYSKDDAILDSAVMATRRVLKEEE